MAAKAPRRRLAPPTLADRSCGALLHLTSLPGPHGCGDLGPAAHQFLDFLAQAGQRWWQMLPIGPAGPGDSPYSSPASMGGDALLVSLESLAAEGWLRADELTPPAGLRPDRVRFALTQRYREGLLRLAYERFRVAPRARQAAFEAYCKGSSAWLDDHAMFFALRTACGGKVWTQWPAELRLRRPAALEEARRSLADELGYQQFVQFCFDKQWAALRSAAHARGIGLIGDLPIFVTHDSVDVWAHPELFQLDARGQARQVTGCPPDLFSKHGQLWGHPQYRWSAHLSTGFGWWKSRLRRLFELFDAVRVDHFIGFHHTWHVPGDAKTAKGGRWVKSPGRELFNAVQAELGKLPLIAEDLGAVSPEVRELRDEFNFPGMRVVQHAFWQGARYDQPHNHPADSVVYTGTHDMDTIVGWWKSLKGDRGPDGLTVRERTLRYLGLGPTSREIHWHMIRLAYASPARQAIIQVQDWLGLDGRARMNMPGTPTGNWNWRLRSGALTSKLAKRLTVLSETYERATAPL